MHVDMNMKVLTSFDAFGKFGTLLTHVPFEKMAGNVL